MLINVLVVDESSVVRRVLRNLLRNIEGLFIAAECRSAPSAISWIERNPPDVVLLDIPLSVGTGMDVLNMVVEKYPQIKVFIVTNLTDDIYRMHYLNAGAQGFFDKSLELPLLQNHLQLIAQAEEKMLASRSD